MFYLIVRKDVTEFLDSENVSESDRFIIILNTSSSPCQGIHSFCLVDASVSFGTHVFVNGWLVPLRAHRSSWVVVVTCVFLCPVRWVGDPLFMGGATARQYSRALACPFCFGAQTRCVYSEAEWDATCLCRCFPRQHRIQAHMLVRMARAS